MGKDFFYIVENSARAGGAVAPPRARVHACVCERGFAVYYSFWIEIY